MQGCEKNQLDYSASQTIRVKDASPEERSHVRTKQVPFAISVNNAVADI
jgi:hypothetical protein